MEWEFKCKCKILNTEYPLDYNKNITKKNTYYWGILQTPKPLEFSFVLTSDKQITEFEPTKTAHFMIKAITDAVL